MTGAFKDDLRKFVDSMEVTDWSEPSTECLSDEEILAHTRETNGTKNKHVDECQVCSERVDFARTQGRLYERYKKAFVSKAEQRPKKPVGLLYALRPFWDALPRNPSWAFAPILAVFLIVCGPIVHYVLAPPEQSSAILGALKQIAGTPDLGNAQTQARSVLTAASEGNSLDPNQLQVARSEVQKRAESNFDVNLRHAWYQVDDQLAGAEVLYRYGALANQKKQVPLKKLGITNVSIQDGRAVITAKTSYVADPSIQQLFADSVGQTNRMTALDLNGPDGFRKSFAPNK
jgi:hypothetical protein